MPPDQLGVDRFEERLNCRSIVTISFAAHPRPRQWVFTCMRGVYLEAVLAGSDQPAAHLQAHAGLNGSLSTINNLRHSVLLKPICKPNSPVHIRLSLSPRPPSKPFALQPTGPCTAHRILAIFVRSFQSLSRNHASHNPAMRCIVHLRCCTKGYHQRSGIKPRQVQVANWPMCG